MWNLVFYLSCTVQSTTDNISSDQEKEKTSLHSTEAIKEETISKARIIVLGDSLSAGMGLDISLAYPALLETQLNQNGYATEIVNAGQSGDTTAGGLQRVDWLLKQNPDLLIVELGANDGMRGIPISEIEKNIRAIIDKAQPKNIPVFLTEMYIPPNFGQEYTKEFHSLFAQIAADENIPLLPFPLEEVAGKAELNQGDGIHPTAKGHQLMAKELLPMIENWRRSWTKDN